MTKKHDFLIIYITLQWPNGREFELANFGLFPTPCTVLLFFSLFFVLALLSLINLVLTSFLLRMYFTCFYIYSDLELNRAHLVCDLFLANCKTGVTIEIL